MDRFYQSFFNIWKQFPVMTAVIAAAVLAVSATGLARRLTRNSARNMAENPARKLAQRELAGAGAGFLTWAFVYAVACVVGALGWGTQWAHFNAYMPAMAAGALACGAALPALLGVLRAWTEPPPGAATRSPTTRSPVRRVVRSPWFAPAVLWAVLAVAALQLYAARWQPRRFIPAARDRRAAGALIAHLRELRRGGDIYVPYHPWYARLAGQKLTYTHRMGILDMTYGGRWRVAGLAEALRSGRFAAVILDDRPVGAEFAGLRRGYRLDDTLPAAMAPRVRTGAKVVPRFVWRPAAATTGRGLRAPPAPGESNPPPSR
jgi:hypothetical protein